MTDARDGGAGGLTHVGADGAARMVDVGAKQATRREARAGGSIRMSAEALHAVRANLVAKGDVLAVARIAGIMAAKRTADLVPLCHPLALTAVEVELEADDALPGVRATATVRCTGPTGVEMEALTAVTVSLLTVYDMLKALDPGMEMGYISVLSKNGGSSGPWQRA
jgi:cyclic pyranopterin monophosphate synthase